MRSHLHNLCTLKHEDELSKLKSTLQHTTDSTAKVAIKAKISKLEKDLAQAKSNLLAADNPLMQEWMGLKPASKKYPIPDDIKSYPSFNPELYQAIYPLILLAHTYEKNGLPEDHAKKLACVFQSKQQVLNYLEANAKNSPDQVNLIHDACLFSIPKSKSSEDRWIKLARQDNNLLNPHFVKLLGLANDIDAHIEEQRKQSGNKDDLLKRYNAKTLTEAKSTIAHQIKEKKAFCDKYRAGQLDREEEEFSNKHKKYLNELDQLYIDSMLCNLTTPKDHYSIQDFDSVYRCLIANSPSKAIFTSLGIDHESYERFLSLDRSKAGKNIPELKDRTLDCGDGLYMMKLNAQDDTEAAIGACLGKLTDCCQSISGEAGESCAIHGLTSEDSGFYVLFKGDAKNPKPGKDTVCAQTWVNRTASGKLVFDSIERAESEQGYFTEKSIITAYRKLADHLVKYYDVPAVHCGTDSGISSDVGINSTYDFHAEAPKNYDGYRDSHNQLFLADHRLMIYIDGYSFDLDQNAWKEELAKCTTVVTEKMRYTIGWALEHNTIDLLLSKIKCNKLVSDYVTMQRNYCEALTNYIADPKITLPLHEDIDINLCTSSGTSALMLAAQHGNLDYVNTLIQRKSTISYKDSQQLTALNYAIMGGHSNVFSLLLSKYDKNEYPDRDVMSDFLIYAVKLRHKDMVKKLLELNANPNHYNCYGDSVLGLAASMSYNIEVVQSLLEAKANIRIVDLDSAIHPNNLDCINKLFDALLMKTHHRTMDDLSKIFMKMMENLKGSELETALKSTLSRMKKFRFSADEYFNWYGKKITLLYQACQTQNLQAVKILLNAKANPLYNSYTAYMGQEYTPLELALYNNNHQILQLLLTQPGVKSHLSKSPYMLYDMVKGHYCESRIRTLLEAKVDLSIKDEDGMSLASYLKKDYYSEHIIALLEKPKVPVATSHSSLWQSSSAKAAAPEDTQTQLCTKPTNL